MFGCAGLGLAGFGWNCFGWVRSSWYGLGWVVWVGWSGSESRLDWDQMGFAGLGWRGLNLVGAGLAGKKWDRVSSNFPELGPDWMGSAVLG